MRTLFIVLVAAMMLGCKSARNVTPSSGNGSSFEQAVLVKAANEREGIKAEYRWLSEHYPGYKRQTQHLRAANGRAYDQLDIVTADGQHHSVYFDITSFFGK